MKQSNKDKTKDKPYYLPKDNNPQGKSKIVRTNLNEEEMVNKVTPYIKIRLERKADKY